VACIIVVFVIFIVSNITDNYRLIPNLYIWFLKSTHQYPAGLICRRRVILLLLSTQSDHSIVHTVKSITHCRKPTVESTTHTVESRSEKSKKKTDTRSKRLIPNADQRDWSNKQIRESDPTWIEDSVYPLKQNYP
jgi:hypothetical protein